MLAIGLYSIYVLVTTGIGVWGNSNTVGWAWDITNFVWWIGIGHAGTLISAILFLFRQTLAHQHQPRRRGDDDLRRHVRRLCSRCSTSAAPWFACWMLPLPNEMSMWPQFRSPLMWDVFAVSTYFTDVDPVLVHRPGPRPRDAPRPLRDDARCRSDHLRHRSSLGWRGSARHWHHYERAYLILAGLSTPLVLSVHSVVSFDFATSQLPGWHTTIFPPYFVAGAIFSGFAMVLTLLLPLRHLFNLKHIIKEAHLEAMCKIMLATGTMVGYAYAMEFFIAWYSGNLVRALRVHQPRVRPVLVGVLRDGEPATCSCRSCSGSRRSGATPSMIFILCIFINIGMWFERFVIIATSLARVFLPSQWGYFTPTRCRRRAVRRHARPVLHAVPAVLPLPADDRDVRGQGRDARGPRRPQEGRPLAMATHEAHEAPPAAPGEGDGHGDGALYGVLAEYDTPGELVEAARKVRDAGYTEFDCYSPVPGARHRRGDGHQAHDPAAARSSAAASPARSAACSCSGG